MKKSARVLIVEDEIIIALEIEMLMRRGGFTVISIARTGKEAIETARAAQPDIVMMDIMLPDGMNGIQAVREIKTFCPCSFVFVTANSDPNTRREAMACGPIAYFEKPLSDSIADEISGIMAAANGS
jgi:DNA-binding NarL/FixJ family response regulator